MTEPTTDESLNDVCKFRAELESAKSGEPGIVEVTIRATENVPTLNAIRAAMVIASQQNMLSAMAEADPQGFLALLAESDVDDDDLDTVSQAMASAADREDERDNA